MTVTFTVAIDWDVDGSFATAGDDITADVMSITTSQGMYLSDPAETTAATGQAIITVKNTDRKYSSENTTGSLYGKLLPNRPVRIQADNGAAQTIFYGYTRDITPTPGQYEDQTATIMCEDIIGQFQDTTLALPLQENETCATILQKICSAAFDGDAATAYIELYDMPENTESIGIGDVTYTFVSALSGAANEVLIESVTDDGEATPGNLAAAINHDSGEGTGYGSGTVMHPYVTAEYRRALGYPSTNGDTWIALRKTGTVYDALATSFYFVSDTITTDTLTFYMKKTGSPTGTCTVTIYSSSGGVPNESDQLFGVTGTFSEADLSTLGDHVRVTLSSAVTFASWIRYQIVITTDRAASGTDYIEWYSKADTAGPASAKSGGTWTANGDYNCFWIPGRIDLSANARGAWANTIRLDAETLHYDATTATVTTGTLITGTLNDLKTSNNIYYQVQEVTGTPGFDVRFTFAGLAGTGLKFHFDGRYEGNVGHVVQVQAWNGATWDVLGTLTTSGTDSITEYHLLSTHTIAGVVLVRIYHVSAGSAAHNLYTDHIYVADDSGTDPDGIHISGEYLTGGTDEPSGLVDFDTGVDTINRAGDTWVEGEVNGVACSRDVTATEYGLYWAARDGTLTFRDRDWLFKQLVTTPALVLTDDHTKQVGKQDSARVFNSITVEYTPRGETSVGVIARLNSAQEVKPGGTERSSPVADRTANTVVVPYVEGGTGKLVGAKSINAPVLNTDYTVNTKADGTGWTPRKKKITISSAINGGQIEASFVSTASKSLYVLNLQYQGIGLTSYQPELITEEDATSIANYRRRNVLYKIPFEVSAGRTFAEGLAGYLLSRFKDPVYRVDSVGLRTTGDHTINGVYLFDVGIGDVITLTETQTGVNAQKFLVSAIEYVISSGGALVDTTLFLRELEDTTYWILGDATYSKLGDTTRLAIGGANRTTFTNGNVIGSVDFNYWVRDTMRQVYEANNIVYTHFHRDSTVTNGNAIATTVLTGQVWNHAAAQNPPAINDAFTFSCVLSPGTYQINFWCRLTSDSGSIRVTLDGTRVLTGLIADLYSAATVANYVLPGPAFTIEEMARYTFTVDVPSKNAASSDYKFFMTAAFIREHDDTDRFI